MQEPQRLETAVVLRIYQSFGFSVLGMVVGFWLTIIALFDIPLARASPSSERIERLLMPFIMLFPLVICTVITAVIPRFVHQGVWGEGCLNHPTSHLLFLPPFRLERIIYSCQKQAQRIET